MNNLPCSAIARGQSSFLSLVLLPNRLRCKTPGQPLFAPVRPRAVEPILLLKGRSPRRGNPPLSSLEENGGADRDRSGDPLLAKQVLSQLSYSPVRMVGLGRVELPTSPLSGVRSNQLSYRPE